MLKVMQCFRISKFLRLQLYILRLFEGENCGTRPCFVFIQWTHVWPHLEANKRLHKIRQPFTRWCFQKKLENARYAIEELPELRRPGWKTKLLTSQLDLTSHQSQASKTVCHWVIRLTQLQDCACTPAEGVAPTWTSKTGNVLRLTESIPHAGIIAETLNQKPTSNFRRSLSRRKTNNSCSR